jgi:tripartite-type tricarboxylate transporter receptor subunit TctC
MRLHKSVALLCVVLAASITAAQAQYPERPVRMIVPFAPGGNVDVTARTITPALSELLGRNFVVDNRSGAGGAVGAEIVATATPDGYTLLVGSTGLLTIAPVIFDKLRYDPAKDFAPISLISKVPLVMLVNAKSPAKSAKEFVALAKSRGGEMTMGSSGNFSTGQLAGALFQNMTGTRFVHVPYKGGSLAMADLIGGHVDLMFDQINAATGHIRGGRVRALALTSTTRSPELPDVPTMSEAGLAGVEAETFNALLAPAGTPRAIIARLNEAVGKVLANKSVRDAFARQGAEVISSTPEAAGSYIRSETAKWSNVIRASGLKTEHR